MVATPSGAVRGKGAIQLPSHIPNNPNRMDSTSNASPNLNHRAMTNLSAILSGVTGPGISDEVEV
jgi:hypothetical protein